MLKRIARALLSQARSPVGLGGRLCLLAMNLAHRSQSKWGLSHLTINPGDEILDIGCGGGANVRRMLASVGQGKVSGLDLSPESVAFSQKLNRRAILENRAEIKRGGADSIPWPEGVFDRVTAFETVYFWPDPMACFREVKRVLKPGGVFLVCNSIDPEANLQDMGFWIELLEIQEAARTDFGEVMREAGFGELVKIPDKRRGLVIIGRAADVPAQAGDAPGQAAGPDSVA